MVYVKDTHAIHKFIYAVYAACWFAFDSELKQLQNGYNTLHMLPLRLFFKEE